MTQKSSIRVDIVIFGGGIAGLWTLHTLLQRGYNAILLETNELGSGQTIKSQGIIHGGLKYALTGSLNASSQALQDMPKYWEQCLQGRGAVDLSTTKILSDHQYMWSINKLTGGAASLFASSAMRSQVQTVDTEQYPLAIKYSDIHSKLYKLSELVLNVPSLIRSLSAPVIKNCIKIDATDNYVFDLDDSGNIKQAHVHIAQKKVSIQAQQFIFTAGTGNAHLINSLNSKNCMQRRPLQMVLLKSANLPPLFGHCIGLSATPRITITTHIAKDHVPVWYLGGKLAEDGAKQNAEQVLKQAQQEIKTIFPKLELGDAQWESFFVDRAEEQQADGSKPQSCTLQAQNNYITAWPTKLALAPVLAEQIANALREAKILPNPNITPLSHSFPAPELAQPIWDKLL